jgi:catechol 2,3-dioxygenase-like lactoylglutathione lyase family enzyme
VDPGPFSVHSAIKLLAMIEVTEVAFVGYPVTDLARARAFYEGLLGLKPHILHDDPGAWIEYEVGPHTIAITNVAPEVWRPNGDGPAMALEVKDFDAAVSALRAARVNFSLEPYESPTCHMCVIADTDGNSLAIHRRKPGNG